MIFGTRALFVGGLERYCTTAEENGWRHANEERFLLEESRVASSLTSSSWIARCALINHVSSTPPRCWDLRGVHSKRRILYSPGRVAHNSHLSLSLSCVTISQSVVIDFFFLQEMDASIFLL